MTKHRLMLSAAVAALSAAALLPATSVPAQADTDITTATSKPLTTSSAGNITIETGGAISAKRAAPLITIDSNNYVLSSGQLNNSDTASAVGVGIDTSLGNLVPPGGGFTSNGSINLEGKESSKLGILISGGHTFYGAVTLSPSVQSVVNGTVAATTPSTLSIKGDNSSALYLVQGTSVTSNILLGGTITQQPAAKASTGGGTIINLDGTVNGDVVNLASITGMGTGIRGIYTAGGLHACASDTGAPGGFACPATAEGALINSGNVSLAGTLTPKRSGVNPESGSALIIAGPVDGGVVNAGPGTASNTTAAVLLANGTLAAPVVMIDPAQSVTSASPAPRGPITIGAISAALDATDPGYAFLNRGTIHAAPTDPQVSSMAMVVRGNSTVNTTTLTGGLLNTGMILAQSSTNQAETSANTPTGLNRFVTATALDIGGFATVPRIDVMSEAVDSSTFTPASIKAEITGVGQGSAYGVFIDEGASVSAITVGKNASILAGVTTTTTSPTKEQGQAGAPFSLVSEAIVDRSNTLASITNSGVIQASNTPLTPEADAAVSNVQRAIDLQNSTRSGIAINNSGVILGDVYYGSAGNNDVLTVGNVDGGGTTNSATGTTNSASNWAVVAMTNTPQGSATPVTTANTINFGSGSGHMLHIGGYGYVNSVIQANDGALDVQVDNNGYLYVANTAATGPMKVNTLTVSGGTLGLTITQNTTSSTPVILANNADVSNANLALQFGGFVASGDATGTTTVATTTNPSPQTITLISSATSLTDPPAALARQNGILSQNIPFLFENPLEPGYGGGDPLSLGNGGKTLQLILLPRATGVTNADGTAGLNLSGDAKTVFPYAAQALTNDNELGAAIASSLTVYNTAGVPSSGINIPKSQQAAQQVFSQFGPDVSGGARQIAIMLTDQATGPVAARQRLLRHFSHEAGDMTLWGEEFTGQVSNKGQVSGSGDLTAYKNHGFGFTVGMDGGSPREGWYGGAFTFYSGDIAESLPRASQTQSEWYMLTAYSEWAGRHVFFDTQGSLAYGNFIGKRTLSVGSLTRTAEGKRAGLMGALGANMGVMLHYLGFQVDPHFSLDGMTLREEGYTENGGGKGMDLKVAPYYATSVRTALGVDLRLPLNIWGVELAPEARAGYRYDLMGAPVKLKAGFQSTGGLSTVNNTIKFVGPDPDQGNTFLGLGLSASTDTWQLGGQFDWVRGSNGSTTQVGTITLLARI